MSAGTLQAGRDARTRAAWLEAFELLAAAEPRTVRVKGVSDSIDVASIPWGQGP